MPALVRLFVLNAKTQRRKGHKEKTKISLFSLRLRAFAFEGSGPARLAQPTDQQSANERQ